jgi:hypothetical protein
MEPETNKEHGPPCFFSLFQRYKLVLYLLKFTPTPGITAIIDPASPSLNNN